MRGRPADPLNVKQHLLWIDETIVRMLAHNRQSAAGVNIPPAYEQTLREISQVTRAILAKHAGKNTRKDIYVGKRDV